MPYTLHNLITTQGGSASYDKRLSICLAADGFSFAETTPDGLLLTFGQAEGRHAATMTDVARDVKLLFSEVGLQPLAYKGMELVVLSDESVWVPDELYTPAANRQYLNLVGGRSLSLATCRCPAIASTAVFAAADHVVMAFKVAMPGATVLNQHAKLVQLAPRSKAHPVLAACWRKGRVDVAAFREGRYLFGNTLFFGNDDEAKFRLLEVVRSYGIESDSTELLLFGEVDRDRFARLRPFFPVVTLFGGNVTRFLNPDFAKFHAYRHALILI